MEQEQLEQERLEQERLEQELLEQEKQNQLLQEAEALREQEEQLYSMIMILLITSGILLTILIIAGTGMIMKRRKR